MAEANPISMSGAHEPRATDFKDQLDAIRRSLDALHYLNTLLDLATFHDGGALADPKSGLSELMGRQLEDIGDAVEALRAAKAESTATSPEMTAEERIAEVMRRAALADAGRPAWHDIEAIAARARVHQDEAARVMFVLTGEDHQGAAYRAWDGNLHEGLPAHLLARHIWNTLAHGEVWGQVSTDTGIPLPRLKEILETMLQYLPRRDAVDLHGFGAAAGGEERTETAVPRDPLSGVDFGQIARETNLKEETVRRVVARLLAEPRPVPDGDEQAAVSNG